ncbi:MAG: DDE-type integrase/transposase/recombinase [Planctomycetota bacterium]
MPILPVSVRRAMDAIHQRNRATYPVEKRPDYLPVDRFEILQIQKLRGWSQRETSRQFVLHPNTIWAWNRAWRYRKNIGLFFGSVPWNKMADGVRWLTHQIRSLCPEPEFGTRRIALELIRAGIEISRSPVQRVLREKKPRRPPEPEVAPVLAQTDTSAILKPKKINQTWHLDFTTLDFLWFRFYIAAIVDGFSRRLLALRVYPDAPTSAMMIRLLRNVIMIHGSPKFLVTDHGSQFRRRFRETISEKLGIVLVKGRVHFAYFMNGKVERFFRTFWIWGGRILPLLNERAFQRRLDTYRDWYNTRRPQAGLGGRTPEEVWNGVPLPDSTPIRERDLVKPAITVTRRRFRGDPRLPVLNITIQREEMIAA